MSDVNEEFQQIYEAIQTIINRFAKYEDSHRFELKEACENSFRIRNRRDELEYIRMVRNAQNHPKQRTGQPTFTISVAFLQACQKLYADLSKAVPAGQMGISVGDLYVAAPTDNILPVVARMRSERFSHIPILNTERVVLGVFNESAILDYLMASELMSFIETDTTLDQIDQHCRIGADHIETFRFISPLASEDDVANIFLTVNGPFTRVGAIFVTQDGHPEKPVQRMITAWDVLAQNKRD